MSLLEISKIKEMYEKCDWFETASIKDETIYIYVNKMTGAILESIPDKINKKNVKVHFYQSRTCCPTMYLKTYTFENFERDFKLSKFVEENTKTYGARIMATMFYEIHDGENSLTSLKIKYPHLHIEMTNYYEEYGYLALSREMGPYGIVH